MNSTTRGPFENETQSVHPHSPQLHRFIIVMFMLQITCLVLGTMGNILSFVIFSRKGMCGSLTAFLFKALSLSDILCLLEILLDILMISGVETFTLNKWSCRLSYWLLESAKCISSWILVAIAVERLICVCIPHRAVSLCTVKRGKIYLISV